MAYEPRPIPKLLTKSDWQKNKGLIAKAAGSTGIGPLMEKLETAYKNVNWEVFNPSAYIQDRSIETIQTFKRTAENEKNSKLSKLRDASLTLSRQAAKIETDWKKSKTIPSSSRKHVASVSEAALNYATSIRDFNWAECFDSLIAEAERTEVIAQQLLQQWLDGINRGIRTVADSPNIETYNKHLHQQIRGLGTAITRIPALSRQWGPEIRSLSVDSFRSKAKTEKDFLQLLVEVRNFIKRFEARN